MFCDIYINTPARFCVCMYMCVWARTRARARVCVFGIGRGVCVHKGVCVRASECV